MRTETIVKEIYKFDELPEKAQDRAIENLGDINVDFEWWDTVYEDAKNIDVAITESDCYRRQIEGTFLSTAQITLAKIAENHGEGCDTYQTAKKYAELFKIDMATKRLLGEEYWDDPDEDLAKEFLRELLDDYLTMLCKEYEYQTSREAIVETIEANGYEFDAEGRFV